MTVEASCRVCAGFGVIQTAPGVWMRCAVCLGRGLFRFTPAQTVTLCETSAGVTTATGFIAATGATPTWPPPGGDPCD